MAFKDLARRVQTAAVLIAGLAALLFYAWESSAGRSLLSVVGVLAIAGAAHEYARFSTTAQAPTAATRWLVTVVLTTPAAVACGLSILGTLYPSHYSTDPLHSVLVSLLGSALVAGGMFAASGRATLDQVTRWASSFPIAFLLVGCGGAALVSVASMSGAPRQLLWLIAVIAVNDSAAYFGGSLIGGAKLSPSISPNKTLSGSFTGLLVGILVGLPLAVSLGIATATPSFAAVIALTVVAGQLGDLLKSYLKRLHGVKDSGTIFPGHGGLLDRIDGMLGGATVALLLL